MRDSFEREVNNMSNRYKCRNYKSAVQFYNQGTQAIENTDLVVNPIILALGTRVTDTGVAIDFNSFDVGVENSGLYRISVALDVLGVTAGDVTFAIALNGQILPETISTITAVAGISELVSFETIRVINTCCVNNDFNFSIVAYSDGTGEATVERLSGNALKLA